MTDRDLADTKNTVWDYSSPGQAKVNITADGSRGTKGQTLTSNGPGDLPTFQDPGAGGGGGATDFQRFNSSGTWTKPDAGDGFGDNSVVLIRAWGAGGGGTSEGGGGLGGGGGGYSERRMLLSELGATETVTIGAGGAGTNSASGIGGDGGNSTFGSHLTGYGASGAIAGKNVSGNGGGPLSRSTGDPKGFPSIAEPQISSVSPAATFPVYLGMGTGYIAEWPARGGVEHGGGGGGLDDTPASNLNGGSSVYGGGGGAGTSNDTAGTGGISVNAGNGGAGGINGANGSNGVQPGGGGGGSETATGGTGGNGRIDVIVWGVAD